MPRSQPPRPFYEKKYGRAYLGNSLEFLKYVRSGSASLILTSPPFALQRKKEYGNEEANRYVQWFMQFVPEFKRILKIDGSIVIDIGGAWNKGSPTKSIYHYELLVSLVREGGLYLAQDFFWWNRAKLPTPAEWVNVRRVRAKDAVNCIWWLSKTDRPKADNRNVLQPYSQSMLALLKNGYKAKLRPSGHDISTKFNKDNRGAIPANILEISNTDSNSHYLRRCREEGARPHPARFPPQLPMFFLKFLTDPGDLVVDPFAGSNVTGAVAEHLKRKWVAIELEREYLEASRYRFEPAAQAALNSKRTAVRTSSHTVSDRALPLFANHG